MMNITISLPSEITKEFIESEVEKLSEDVIEGATSGLKRYIALSAIEKIASLAKEKVLEDALDEAERYSLPYDRRVHGVDFQIRNGRVTYDYTGSEQWVRINNAKQDAILAQKEFEKQLKRDYLYGDKETGEVSGEIDVKKVNSQTLTVTFR